MILNRAKIWKQKKIEKKEGTGATNNPSHINEFNDNYLEEQLGEGRGG